MKEKIKKMLTMGLVIVLALSPIVAINAAKIEGKEVSGDSITIEYNNTDPTNGNVLVTITSTDEASGVDKLFLVDAEKEDEIELKDEKDSKVGIFTVESNGKYTFKLKDVAGNETTAEVDINNIDKVMPGLTLTPSTTDLTNMDVVITAKATDNVEIAKLILPDETEAEDVANAEYTVSKNGTYTFKTIDTAGNETSKSITVSNINKTKATIEIDYDDSIQSWTNKDIIVKATAKDKNGKEIKLEVAEHTFSKNGSFTFTATDDWGNKTDKTVTVTKIDKTPPKMDIKVKNQK